MALVGGGGAGNVAGSNPAGTGKGLNFIRTEEGTFAFANSGTVGCDNNETTLLKFTSGPSLIVSQVLLNYAEDAAHLQDYIFKIKVDSEIIMMFLYDGAKLDNPPQAIPLMIAPFADIEITAVNITDTNTRTMAAMVTGRVY